MCLHPFLFLSIKSQRGYPCLSLKLNAILFHSFHLLGFCSCLFFIFIFLGLATSLVDLFPLVGIYSFSHLKNKTNTFFRFSCPPGYRAFSFLISAAKLTDFMAAICCPCIFDTSAIWEVPLDRLSYI